MYMNLSVTLLASQACLTGTGSDGGSVWSSKYIIIFIFRYINVLYTIYIYYSVMTLMISNQHLYIYPQTHATHKQKPNRTTLSLSLSLSPSPSPSPSHSLMGFTLWRRVCNIVKRPGGWKLSELTLSVRLYIK